VGRKKKIGERKRMRTECRKKERGQRGKEWAKAETSCGLPMPSASDGVVQFGLALLLPFLLLLLLHLPFFFFISSLPPRL